MVLKSVSHQLIKEYDNAYLVFTSCLRLASILTISSSTWSMLSRQAFYDNMEDRPRASSNEFCSNHQMNIAQIIECILLELFHKCRRESNAYQGEFIEFCYKFIECIEQNQIYLNFIVNMWKLSNAYTRHRILTHFGNHSSLMSRIDLVSKNLLANCFRHCRKRNN